MHLNFEIPFQTFRLFIEGKPNTAKKNSISILVRSHLKKTRLAISAIGDKFPLRRVTKSGWLGFLIMVSFGNMVSGHSLVNQTATKEFIIIINKQKITKSRLSSTFLKLTHKSKKHLRLQDRNKKLFPAEFFAVNYDKKNHLAIYYNGVG